jgi:ureidoglycolate lyase
MRDAGYAGTGTPNWSAPGTEWIPVEPVSPEAFAPYGHVISVDSHAGRHARGSYTGRVEVFRSVAIDSDKAPEFLLLRSQVRPFRVRLLERHMEIGQAFIPLANHPFAVVVAAPAARLIRGVPALDEIHGFLVPGNIAISLHRGTWHEPPYALVPDSLMLITSHPELTQGLQAPRGRSGEVHDLDVEKRNVTDRLGVVVWLSLHSSGGA